MTTVPNTPIYYTISLMLRKKRKKKKRKKYVKYKFDVKETINISHLKKKLSFLDLIKQLTIAYYMHYFDSPSLSRSSKDRYYTVADNVIDVT